MHTNLLNVPAKFIIHEILIISHPAAPVGGDGAQFGRIFRWVDDEMGDARLELRKCLLGSFQTILIGIQRHPPQCIQQWQTGRFKLLDERGCHFGKFRVQTGCLPASLVQAEDHGGQMELHSKLDIYAHEFDVRHRAHVGINMGGDDPSFDGSLDLSVEFRFDGSRITVFITAPDEMMPASFKSAKASTLAWHMPISSV
jgi:hypothetical protein